MLIFRSLSILKLKIVLGSYIPSDNLLTTEEWKSMVVEVILMSIHPSPLFISWTYTESHPDLYILVDTRINDILLCFSLMIKQFLVARFLLSCSIYMTPRAQRVTFMNGTEANYNFVVKSMMKSHPVETLSVSLMFFAFIVAYCLRIFEGPYSELTG